MTQGSRKKLGLEGEDRENGGDARRAVAFLSQVRARCTAQLPAQRTRQSPLCWLSADKQAGNQATQQRIRGAEQCAHTPR